MKKYKIIPLGEILYKKNAEEVIKRAFGNFYEKQGYKKLYDNLNEEGLYTLYKKVEF